MNIQILSAGLGTRLKPITDEIPKPALCVLNIPMIFWSLHYFARKKFHQIVVNTFHLQGVLKEQLKNYNHGFEYISDGTTVLGTGGGIANAKSKISGQGNFWVINGDCIFLTDTPFISETEIKHNKTKSIATLVVTEHPEVGYKFGGIWTDDEDKVLDMGKNRPSTATRGYHFTGFRVLSEDIFKYLKNEPSELFDGLRAAMADGHKISIVKVKGDFFETGNAEDYLKTTQILLNYRKHGNYKVFLDSLFEKYSPHSKLNDFDLLLKMNLQSDIENLLSSECVTIFDEAQLDGFIVLGKNVVVREGAYIKDSVILDNTIVEKNSQIINAIHR